MACDCKFVGCDRYKNPICNYAKEFYSILPEDWRGHYPTITPYINRSPLNPNPTRLDWENFRRDEPLKLLMQANIRREKGIVTRTENRRRAAIDSALGIRGAWRNTIGAGRHSLGPNTNWVGPMPMPRAYNIQKKSCDLFEGTLPITANGAFMVLNDVLEGASFYNRIGRQIEMSSLHLTGQIVPTGLAPSVGAPIYDYGRIMVIYDAQTNGAFPTPADILTSYNNTGLTQLTSRAFLNMNNRDRFKIWADIRLDFPDIDFTTVGGVQTNGAASIIDYKGEFNIDRFIKLKGSLTHYKASAGNIGDISTGGLYLFAIGAQGSGFQPYNFVLSARLRYKDTF